MTDSFCARLCSLMAWTAECRRNVWSEKYGYRFLCKCKFINHVVFCRELLYYCFCLKLAAGGRKWNSERQMLPERNPDAWTDEPEDAACEGWRRGSICVRRTSLWQGLS